jgi:hypothetical protein
MDVTANLQSDAADRFRWQRNRECGVWFLARDMTQNAAASSEIYG